MFPLSSSLLSSSHDADTEGEPIVCVFSQSTGQKASHFISFFESKAVLRAGLTCISVHTHTHIYIRAHTHIYTVLYILY